MRENLTETKNFFHSKLNKGQSNQFIAKLITRKKKRREAKKKIFHTLKSYCVHDLVLCIL